MGIGSEPARVRVQKIGGEGNVAVVAMDVLRTLLTSVDVSAVAMLRSAHDSEVGGPVIDIQGEDSGLLIGRRGETLRATQFLVNLIVNNGREDSVRVAVDVEQYIERRDRSVKELAIRIAERVESSGRSISLEPMLPRERRVVHMALADRPRVTTESAGVGNDRCVSIIPVKKKEDIEDSDSNESV